MWCPLHYYEVLFFFRVVKLHIDFCNYFNYNEANENIGRYLNDDFRQIS